MGKAAAVPLHPPSSPPETLLSSWSPFTNKLTRTVNYTVPLSAKRGKLPVNVAATDENVVMFNLLETAEQAE